MIAMSTSCLLRLCSSEINQLVVKSSERDRAGEGQVTVPLTTWGWVLPECGNVAGGGRELQQEVLLYPQYGFSPHGILLKEWGFYVIEQDNQLRARLQKSSSLVE